ncbi:MAG TPA: ABC transporter substrate-binding protein [Eoetvoesiella sp.]|uniref:ABC transporter substrate-binding protein n=1 Tax=Eoetvoesiella sp. TaxID=1966355 RepID=UPI002B9FEAD6|nr:ABC transporter substrate-binding protein [Eoetvoesiella sp.]HWK61250.1 ABC transporter substrate-binding protein [Eoetvoesiella sp.]
MTYSFFKLAAASTVATACFCTAAAQAATAPAPLKIGVILPFSGPYAPYGEQISSGIKVYMKEHGDTVAGRKVQVIYKDDTGVAPEVDKRLAQELLVNEKVDLLAGFGMTPSALAVAPLATKAKCPMVVMNAGSAVIPSRSPYIIRVSESLPQVTRPAAKWAAKHGIKKVYTLVADYAPGIDTEKAFTETFEKLGGTIVGSVRVPVTNTDFASYIQKIKDEKPDAVFMFLPPGPATISFVKSYHERGLRKAGIKMLGTHDLTEETLIDSLGNGVIGTITSGYYSAAHDSDLNRKFVKEYKAMFGPDAKINFMSATGYDGMAAIYAALTKTGGDSDGDKLMQAFKGMSFESPRGPVTIDPVTRDMTQNIYMREVKLVDGHLANVEFDKEANVKAQP